MTGADKGHAAMTTTMRRLGALAAMALTAAASVWDDEGLRPQAPCQAQLDRCLEACQDRRTQRPNVDIGVDLEDPFACEPRRHQRRALHRGPHAEGRRLAGSREPL